MDAQNVNEILDALGARFGATGAHLWDVLIRQAYVEFAVAVVMTIAAAGLSALAAWLWRKGIAADYEDETVWFISATLISIIAASFLIAMFVQGSVGLTAVMNPEYFALQKVLGAFQ